jgi:hypothetical protein
VRPAGAFERPVFVARPVVARVVVARVDVVREAVFVLAGVARLEGPFGRAVAPFGLGPALVERVLDDAVAFFFATGVARLRGAAEAAAFLTVGRAGVRRGFGLAGSCIVASIFTSRGVSSRQSPGVSSGSAIGPMATRRSFETG